MRKSLCVISILLAVFMLAGCSSGGKPQNENNGDKVAATASIMDVLDDGMLAIYENREAELPVAAKPLFAWLSYGTA